MLEYLACGLPVVASNLLAVHEFREAIAIADSTEEWESALSAAINGAGKGNPSSRLAVAKANSWDMRASSLNVLLQEMASDRMATEKDLAKVELAA
jgi:glycosyltransferase involved in cell wall biosynthesis